MKSKRKKDSRKKKVLHVTDFRELFELPDDLRKNRPGPLTYTKSFVTLTAGSKESDIKHFERLEELKSRQERHLLRSIFEDIKNWSGKKTIRHRGFLLTTGEQPASYGYLSGQLRVGIEELKQAMPILEEIGLIERVPIDTLETNGRLTKTTKKQGKVAGTKRQKSKHRKNPGKKKCEAPDESGRIRMNPAASGTKRKPLYNPTKHNDKKKSNETKNKTNGSDNSERKIKNRQRRIKRIIDDHRAGKLKSQTKSATTIPATAQPILPRKSAGSGGQVLEFPNAPPTSVGSYCDTERHRYEDDCMKFAGDIYQALGLIFSPLSVRGRRELGSFASVWEKAKTAGLPPDVLEDIRHRAVAEAGKISKRRRRCGNVSAVFCFVFARLVASRCMVARTELEVCG